MEKEIEKVILVGVQRRESDVAFDYSMQELAELTKTARGEVLATLVQKREQFDPRTIIGKGKLEELIALVEELKPDTIIFQNELSARNVRNIQEVIDCKVLDRVQLILDIFAMRARSREGKLQVELAQLEYLLPRLAGQGKNMSRQGGGIGTRGPGETKLESDRRYIRELIQECKRQLAEVKAHRSRSRENRQNHELFQIGLIGYTNAGKSTLLNRLTDADTYEKNQLFATLDPLTRQFLLEDQYKVTLTDTVGFIQDIPTQLIHAFESTLEESKGVDLLLHVVDASAENYESNEQTVLKIVNELGMDNIPMLTVYNKKDLAPYDFTPILQPNIVISALNADDIKQLQTFIWQQMQMILKPYRLVFELGQEKQLTQLTRDTFVIDSTFDEEKLQYVVTGYAKSTSSWVHQANDEDE